MYDVCNYAVDPEQIDDSLDRDGWWWRLADNAVSAVDNILVPS